jgi:lipoprotein-releasing system permease protein
VDVALLIAQRFLRRRGTPLLRTSASAALAAVSLGVAALVVVLALMSGYRDALRRGILSAGGQAVAIVPRGLGPADLDGVRVALHRIAGVAWVGAVTFAPGLVVSAQGEDSQAVTVKATDHPPPFVHLPPGGKRLGVAIGDELARALAARVGSVVSLQVVEAGRFPRSLPVQVAQIFHTGFAEIDEGWVVARLGALRAHAPGLRVGGVEIGLDDPDRVDALLPAIEAACGASALVTTWRESNRNLFAALRWQKLSLAVVLSLVLGVGAVEVAAALIVLMTEKRRELGVLLALGAPSGLIRRTLVIAGGSLGAAGVLGGVVLGLGVVALLNALGLPSFGPEIASVYMVDHIPLVPHLADVGGVVALGLIEVVLASLLPAWRATARDPLLVLRWV